MVECGQVDRWHGSRSWLRPFVYQLIDRGSALLSDQEIASQINSGFLQPMVSLQRLEFLPSHSEDLSPLTLSEPAVLSALKRLNPMKAAGLDGVVWWRRTQPSLLAQLAVQNSSFAEQRRPSSWKMVPVPKLKPVIDINKYLRPISPTSVISKLAQDFVALHFDPTVLEVIDPNQYQRPLPYTPLRTCYMYLFASHRRVWGCCESRPVWLQEGLRSQRPHPTCAQSFWPIFSCAVALWVADFLTHRQQRVKLSRDCFYEWGPLVCLKEPN